jgi:hypothetical protein
MTPAEIKALAHEMGAGLDIVTKLGALLRLENEDGGHCMTKAIIREAIAEISALRDLA